MLCVVASAQAVPATLPWKISKSELKCLAENIYHEARGESTLGKLAVAKVTINRTLNSKFPATICAVVYQPGQFSWTSNKIAKSDQESRYIAHIALTGEHELKNFKALYYHNKTVKPKWKMQPTKTIGRHIFY